jgi:hypothetical protein
MRGEFAVGIVVLGMLSRLLPHPPNLTLTTALALFAGSTCRSRWAVAIPLLTMAATDLILGLHATIPFTWSGLLLIWLIGRRLGPRPRLGIVAAASLGASVLFFLVSNLGVWLLPHGTTTYPRTAEGLWQCYVMALPFFRTALMGDLIFSAGLFGAWMLLTAPQPAAAPAPSPRS